MFDFLKYLDVKLVPVITQLENDIKYKSGNIMITIQTFCELMLKLVEFKETGIKVKRKALGKYLEDEKFTNILLNDLYIDTQKLDEINKIANRAKHDSVYNYSDDEIEQYIKFIFYISTRVLKYYFADVEIEPKYQEDYYTNIRNSLERDTNKIKEQYAYQINEKNKEYKMALENALKQKEILENRIKMTEQEKEVYKEKIGNLDNLEITLRLKDKKITELRQIKAKLEEQLNEKESEEKDKLEKEIRTLKKESYALKEKIKELRSQDIIDPKIKIDRDSKILEEKNREIEELKALINNQEMVKNDKLYKLYKRNALQLGFSSSYIIDDYYFVVTGVSKEVLSTSKYKSFYAVLNNILQRGNLVTISSYLKEKRLSDDELKYIYRIEMTILSLIRNNKLNDKYWNLNLINGEEKNLKFACEDIIYWIKLFTSISDLKYEEPNLNLSVGDYKENYINIKYDNKQTYDINIYNIIDCALVDTEDNDDFFNIWIDDYIKYKVTNNKLNDLEKILKELFGFEHFNEGQFEILEHTLNGNNTIGILPTGGGKSLIYQFASLLEPKISIVVDPINSLIKDQIDGLNKKFGITRCLNLTSSNENRIEDERKLRNSNAMFVFISPERFQIGNFRNILMGLSFNHSIERIVLDEVHCLSEWGHDFRIPYLMLADTLKAYCGDNVKYLGLTATAAASVINDLIVELSMETNDVIFLKQLRRKNLTFKFMNFEQPSDMSRALLNKIEDVKPYLNGDKTNSMIIFSRTQGGKSFTSIDNTYSLLQPLYGNILEIYHGKLSTEEKENAQDNFINNKKSILIATKAFGMGIDKPNIRCTIHYGIPNSFEAFYQEAGRAGRDKKPSNCYIYTYKYSDHDKQNINKFFDDTTDVYTMKEISDYLKYTDLNTNLWFFTNNLSSPQEEADSAYKLYKILTEKSNDDKIIIGDDKKWSQENKLYILHKLGIVTNWEKNYSTHTLIVDLSSYYNNIDYIKNEANKYISQYKDFREINEKIEMINSIEQLKKLIFIIREWYFNNFILGRKNQLYNMIDKIEKFANKDCSEEIQKEIDSYFDLTNIIFATDEGYSLKFENESVKEIIKYIAELDDSLIEKRQIEMERILESITTQNISLYTSLLFLKKGEFDSRNGRQRFEYVYNEATFEDKVEIMSSLAEELYPVLNNNQKELLLNTLYYLDYDKLRSVFLEHVQADSISKKYWLLYINNKLSRIMNGGKKNE